MYSLDPSVIVLFMELPPVELHFLLSLNCFRLLAHWSIASSCELSLALVSFIKGSFLVLLISDFKSKLQPEIVFEECVRKLKQLYCFKFPHSKYKNNLTKYRNENNQ